MECITTVYVFKADRSIDIMLKANNTYGYWYNNRGYEKYYSSLEALVIDNQYLRGAIVNDIFNAIEGHSSILAKEIEESDNNAMNQHKNSDEAYWLIGIDMGNDKGTQTIDEAINYEQAKRLAINYAKEPVYKSYKVFIDEWIGEEMTGKHEIIKNN